MTLALILRELAAEVRRDVPKPLDDHGPEATIMRTLVRLLHEAEHVWTWEHDGYSWSGVCGPYIGRVISTQVNVCELWRDGKRLVREESAEDVATCKGLIAGFAERDRGME